MPVRLSQGAVSWTVQKYRANVQPDGAGQPLPHAATVETVARLKGRKIFNMIALSTSACPAFPIWSEKRKYHSPKDGCLEIP